MITGFCARRGPAFVPSRILLVCQTRRIDWALAEHTLNHDNLVITAAIAGKCGIGVVDLVGHSGGFG